MESIESRKQLDHERYVRNRPAILAKQEQWRSNHPSYNRDYYRAKAVEALEERVAKERKLKEISAKIDAYFSRMYNIPVSNNAKKRKANGKGREIGLPKEKSKAG